MLLLLMPSPGASVAADASCCSRARTRSRRARISAASVRSCGIADVSGGLPDGSVRDVEAAEGAAAAPAGRVAAPDTFAPASSSILGTTTRKRAHGASARRHPRCPTRKQARHLPDILRGQTRTHDHRISLASARKATKSRGLHGSVHECAHRAPNFTGDRSEARGCARSAILPGGCAHLTVSSRGGTQGRRAGSGRADFGIRLVRAYVPAKSRSHGNKSRGCQMSTRTRVAVGLAMLLVASVEVRCEEICGVREVAHSYVCHQKTASKE